jgi:3D (Asp-Asp-Asp) domain-containing protein
MKKLILISALVFCFVKSYDTKYKTLIIKESKVEDKEQFKVTATMYYAVVGQCDASPLVTACGYKINPRKASEHKWIAVSRDLLKKFKYGDKVKISNAGEKDGIYTIADTMNKRFKNKIDFLETKGTSLYKLNDVVLTKV